MNQKLGMHGGVKLEWRFDLTPELLAVMRLWDTMKLLAYGELFLAIFSALLFNVVKSYEPVALKCWSLSWFL